VYNTVIEYTVMSNTTLYWFFIYVNYMTTCFHQRLVIFRPVMWCKNKITIANSICG